MSKKRKRYTHSDAYIQKRYFNNIRKEYGEAVVEMIHADWAAELAQVKKAQLVERAKAAKAWQAKNPGQPLPKQFTERMTYTDLPSYRDYNPNYYAQVRDIMQNSNVSKDVAEQLYEEVPDDQALNHNDMLQNTAELLRGRRAEFYNKAAGTGDPFRSSQQIKYEQVAKLAQRLLLADYWDLAEAAAEGRYREALEYNKSYIENLMRECDKMIDTLEQMQIKREGLLRDPNLSSADAAIINNDYAKDALMIRELNDKLRDLQKLLDYQIRGMKREELRKLRRQLGVE